MRLNLGCGNTHIDGFLNVDKEASCRPDKIQDLENFPWDFKGDMGMNPAGRLMGRMMDKFLGPDYEKGLDNLKKSCENA